MATLAIGEILKASTVTVDSGRRLGITEGGLIRGRNAFDAPVFTIRFVIKTDLTGKAALDTFYGTYSEAWNLATIDDKTYTWLFSNKPMVVSKDGPIRFIEFQAAGYEA